MKTTLLILAVLLLAGCAKQEFERKVTLNADGQVTSSVCRVEASSFWRVTATERLNGTVSCADERDTTFGLEGHQGRGDAELLNSLGGLLGTVAEGAAKGAKPGP